MIENLQECYRKLLEMSAQFNKKDCAKILSLIVDFFCTFILYLFGYNEDEIQYLFDTDMFGESRFTIFLFSVCQHCLIYGKS